MDELLNQLCEISSGLSFDDAKNETFSDITEDVPCRAVEISKIVKDARGNDVQATKMIQVAQNVSIGSRITVDSESFKVISKNEWRDEDELFGCQLFCENWKSN